jgi:hypothetical protein
VLITLSEPFFSGTHPGYPTLTTSFLSDNAGDLTVPAPDTILLDGVQYAVDTKQYRHASRRTMRDSTAIAGEPTDSLFDTQGAWARYRHSWHLGMGQFLDDLGDENVTPFRFEYGENVDILTNGEVTIQEGWYECQEFFGASAASASCFSFANNYAIASQGDQTRTCIYGTFTSPLWSVVTGMTGATQIATDGVDFYLANSSNLYTVASGATTASVLSAGACDTVAFAANRLLVGVGNELFEVQAGGTRVSIREHFQNNFRWNAIFAIGSRIYVGGYAGSRGELYSLTTTEGGSLVLSAEAAPFEPGEYLLNAVAYSGFAVLLTNLGARFSQVGADGTLTYGPRISLKNAGAVQNGLTVGGGLAWFCQVDEDGECVLIEMDLTQFTDTLKPVYVVAAKPITPFDVTALQYVKVPTTGEDPRYILGMSGNFIYSYGLSGDERVTGMVRTGLIRFGTVEEKVLVEIEVGFDQLPALTSVTIEVYNDDDTLIAGGTQSTDGAETLTVALGNTSVRGCYVILKLDSTSSLSTPRVRYWRMRAYPVAPPVQEWIVPLINHEVVMINNGEGQEQAQNPKDVRDNIAALWEAKTPTTYVEGDASYTVRVEDFEIAPAKWTSDGKYFQGIVSVRLVRV